MEIGCYKGEIINKSGRGQKSVSRIVISDIDFFSMSQIPKPVFFPFRNCASGIKRDRTGTSLAKPLIRDMPIAVFHCVSKAQILVSINRAGGVCKW